MNKKTNIIVALLLAVAGVFSLTSCDDDEPNVAKAVLCSVFSLDFDADGGSQEVKVVSDAEWHFEAPDWITVEPSKGSGTTFVTITVGSNFTDGVMDARRAGNVVFKGNTKASEAVVAVRQTGDNYKNAANVDAAGFYGVEEDNYAVVKNLTVVARYEGGFVATDGKSNVNVVAADAPAVGTAVTVYCSRKDDKYGMAYALAEKIENGGTAAAVPAAVDITENIDNYKASTLTHVTLTGVYDASTSSVTVADKKNRGFVAIAAGIDMKQFSSHRITVDAYYLGTAAPAVNLIVAGVTDHGLYEIVYFQDDFEWLEPWSCQKPAGQTVEDNNPSATAQQLGTNTVDGVSTYEALLGKGYSFPISCAPSKSPREPQAQTYLQRNYLKFGLTDYYSGLTLPALTEVPDGASTVICFDWCSQRQGSGKWDPTELVVVVKNGESEEQFLVPTHAYEDNEVYAWLSVRVDLGTSVSKNSTVTIRNVDSQWPAASGALRWFIDNIKIIEK